MNRWPSRRFNESQINVDNPFVILHEDAGLLVVNKPAGLVCHPTKPDGHSSLISRVRTYLGPDGAPRLVNRLDRETSGVVVIAKSAEVARELGRIFESRAVAKEYLAIVHGHLREDTGRIDAPLGKDEQSRVAIKNCVRPDGAPAQTEFSVLRRFARAAAADVDRRMPVSTIPQFNDAMPPASFDVQRSTLNVECSPRPFTFLRLRPLTGRKHQLRIHLAHIRHPIVGDKIYGPDEQIYLDFVAGRLTEEQQRRLILPQHALHAAELCFTWRGCDWRFRAEPECGFTAFLSESGGRISLPCGSADTLLRTPRRSRPGPGDFTIAATPVL